jgi:DNA-binding transcriptional LysR family regulator
VAVHVELRHLRYFVAVAEELNFSRAAERLHIAQPALSAQIRSLEAQLGTPLFVRTTRKVELTATGTMLLEDAREVLALADAAVAKLRAASRGERGELRIGFAAHGAGEVGMEILRRFAEKHPAIESELISAPSLEELQRQVRDRETDVAFVWLPLLYDELEAEVVLAEQTLAVLHPEHRLAAEAEVRQVQLADHPIVAPWDDLPEPFVRAWFGAARPDGRADGDPSAVSVDESLAFVSRGMAIYCVPESASRFYGRPEVVFRPIVDAPPVESAVAWRRDSRSPVIGAFVETAWAVVAAPIQNASS